MARSPAYEKFPGHSVEVAPKPGRVRVEFAGQTIAESTRRLNSLIRSL